MIISMKQDLMHQLESANAQMKENLFYFFVDILMFQKTNVMAIFLLLPDKKFAAIMTELLNATANPQPFLISVE